MLALLYCLSKFIVYKYYLQIKTLIVNEALKREVKANEIIDLDNKNDFIFHFYNKADVTIKSSFQFVYDNGKIETKEFEVQSKNNFKNKVVLAGKHIKYSLVDNYNDVLFIKNFDKETDKYLSYFEGQFEKKDDNIFISSSKRLPIYELPIARQQGKIFPFFLMDNL